jgi:hypothetical protein
VTLGRSTGSAVVATLTFTVTGNEPIRCSTLSSSEGVDFVFTRISRINSIVQSAEDVCTISVQSTAEPGDTNARESTLAAASTFSVSDTVGNTQTVLSGSPQTIWVQRIARPVISLSATTETVNLNVAMNGYTVTSSGGTVASYSLTGTLPAGLSFSTTTGRITGTPTVTQTATIYTITATNTSGSGTATFTLTVVRTCANGGECIVGNTGPGGGIVFYVSNATFTQTGATGAMCTTTCKYLEAAPANWQTHASINLPAGDDPQRSWATDNDPGAGDQAMGNQRVSVAGTSNEIGSGYQNSLLIVAQVGNVAASSAAVLVRGYTGGTKTDWYLPSKNEWPLLYAQRSIVGLPNVGTYWTSSEDSFQGGRYFRIQDQKEDEMGKQVANWVRAVRAFG